MPREWEQGSAARQPEEEAFNPYQMVDYAARLSQPPRRSRQSSAQSYQPGQLYGYSAPPPMAAPVQEEPAYMQPPQSYEAPQLTPGAPYGMNAYQNGPQPFGQMWNEPAVQMEQAKPEWMNQPAAVQMEQAKPEWMNQPVAVQMEQAKPEETEQALPETELRDAFTPAEDSKNPVQVVKPPRTQRPRLRVDRLIFLTLAVAMILFCGIVGGRMIAQLAASERQFEQARDAYREETGMELQAGAARVELLPGGQTFAPTATPTPTVFVPTPKPTPIIPVREGAAAGGAAVMAAAEVTSAPARTKLTVYPKNPLCNIHESLLNLIAENGDVVGRLVIPGLLDEVVVQRNNTYYLSRSYTGTPREGGSVFVDESCSFRMPPENLLLRAQGSVPGRGFAALNRFVSDGAAFVSTAATATLTTLYEQEQYVLFAVINASGNPGSAAYFNYASHPTFPTDDAMMTYVNSARAHSLYPFNVDVVPSDRLLTLSTLGGETSVVLIYRMARDGEWY